MGLKKVQNFLKKCLTGINFSVRINPEIEGNQNLELG